MQSKSRPDSFAISVIIPTLNGGADLVMLVESLLCQELCDLEIIIIDSGSTNGSLGLIHNSSKIRRYEIPAQDFSHSATRNMGLGLAKHPIVFFTVQDAYLPHKTDLFRACEILVEKNLVALSFAETPRDDADQYAKFALHSYYHGMYRDAKRTLVHEAWTGNDSEKIMAASLGNVACLYQRQALVQWPFEGRFAEDFNAAVNFLKAGQLVGKTNEVEVVHSHTRPAFYALQRNYLSERLMQSHGLSILGKEISEDFALGAAIELVERFGANSLANMDHKLSDFVSRLIKDHSAKKTSKSIYQAIEDLGHWFEPSDEGDVSTFKLKLFAGHLGLLLGRVEPESWSSDERRAIVQSLGDGV